MILYGRSLVVGGSGEATMSTTPLDNLRRVAGRGRPGPRPGPAAPPAAPPAADLDGRISRQQPREVLGQLGLHVGELIGAHGLRQCQEDPANQPLGGG
jgi:hypothetical protein